MLRLGIVDLGTNSTRLLIADASEAGVHPLVKKAVTTRLGYKIDKTGLICEESINKTIEVIMEYKEMMNCYGVEGSFAFATSAVRSAKNRNEVVEAISKKTGMHIRVVDGDQEAYLGYLGVRTQYMDDIPMLVIDIGGGSTEFIVGHHGKVLYRKSLPLGCVRLTEGFIKKYPVEDSDIEGLRTYVKDSIKDVIDEIKNMAQEFKVVSIGGTATTLSAIVNGIERVENSAVTLEDIEGLVKNFKSRDLESLKDIDVIQEGRHDIILAGTLELEAIITMLERDRTFVTMRDSLEGVALYMIHEN